MVERCQRYLDAYRSTITYQILHQDVCDTPIENASMIVMNFTLQFIAKQKRDALIAKLYKDMLPEGILVISEKISHPTESGNQLLENLHHEFKRRNGYSELEISQKRSALESIMQTESLDTHRKRLFDAGFKDVILWFNCFNFCSMVAVK
jgi:tRNA (cmo5U34)-methyltransferase